MTFYEYVGNIHIHTPFSDGSAFHAEIAQAAKTAGLNFVITTDHNILVQGVEGYYGSVLVLTGEEVHDRARRPMVNHCLVLGAEREMVSYASQPQQLIDTVHKAGGMTFLAHPFDTDIRWTTANGGIPWVDWDIKGFTGLEIWNYMSALKPMLKTPIQSVRHIFTPENLMTAPSEATLAKWDELLSRGMRVVGIGGSDAHGLIIQKGVFKHIIYPYDYLFSCVNTHILTSTPLAGDAQHDKQLIYHALKMGRAFIGYDFIGSTKGFRFTAQGGKGGTSIPMGGNIRLEHGVTLQALAPRRAHLKLIHQGKVVLEEANAEALTFGAQQAGAYRVEVWLPYKGVERCWIISNPIYIEPNIRPVTSD